MYSFAADLFDGMAARRFNQCSSFGGMLDMVTDRCSTLGLLFILYGEYGGVEQKYFGVYRMVRFVFSISYFKHKHTTMYEIESVNDRLTHLNLFPPSQFVHSSSFCYWQCWIYRRTGARCIPLQRFKFITSQAKETPTVSSL